MDDFHIEYDVYSIIAFIFRFIFSPGISFHKKREKKKRKLDAHFRNRPPNIHFIIWNLKVHAEFSHFSLPFYHAVMAHVSNLR